MSYKNWNEDEPTGLVQSFVYIHRQYRYINFILLSLKLDENYFHIRSVAFACVNLIQWVIPGNY